MTTSELRNRVSVQFKSYGHYLVTISYYGKEYKTVTTNTLAIDRMRDDDGIDNGKVYVTPKQALEALYNECKRNNSL